jgi:hypothetical protein
MLITLPPSIAAYFDADREGGDAIAVCFSPDAVVKDEGQTYRGREEIRRWREDVAAKFSYTCEPLAVEEHGERTVVTCRLEGNFPGSPVNLRFFFRVAAEEIKELEIVP